MAQERHIYIFSQFKWHSFWLPQCLAMFLPKMCCSGCGNHFSTHGLQSHLLQSNNPACQDEFCKWNQAHLADIVDEDIDMEIADNEEHVQAFGGDFFGSAHCPSQRRRGRRKWGLALSIECKILTAIHMSISLTIPMAIGQKHLFRIRTPYHLMSSISLILVVLISMHCSCRSWTGQPHSGQKCEAQVQLHFLNCWVYLGYVIA